MPPSSDRPTTSGQPRFSSSWARVKRETSQVAAGDADRLAGDEADHDADRDAVGQRGAEAGEAADGHAGGEEREDRDGDPGRQRPEAVLEVLGQARAGVRAARRLAAHDRHGEGEQHAGDGGVHAGLVHEHPRERRRAGAAATSERTRFCTRSPKSASGTSVSARKPSESSLGVEDRDDDDGQQVVDHGEGEQEGAQRARQVGADHRQDGEGEGDVGGRRDRPAAQRAVRAAEVEQHEEQRGHGHAADRRGDRQRGPARLAQVAGDELALELEARDEEEDRQQAVGRPGAERQVQVQRRRARRGCRAAPRRPRPRGSSPRPGRRPRRRAAAPRRRSPCGGPRRCAGSRARSRGRGGGSGAVVTGRLRGKGSARTLPTRLPGAPGPTLPGEQLPDPCRQARRRPARRRPACAPWRRRRTPDSSQTASAACRSATVPGVTRRRPAVRRGAGEQPRHRGAGQDAGVQRRGVQRAAGGPDDGRRRPLEQLPLEGGEDDVVGAEGVRVPQRGHVDRVGERLRARRAARVPRRGSRPGRRGRG